MGGIDELPCLVNAEDVGLFLAFLHAALDRLLFLASQGVDGVVVSVFLGDREIENLGDDHQVILLRAERQVQTGEPTLKFSGCDVANKIRTESFSHLLRARPKVGNGALPEFAIDFDLQ